MKVKPHLVATAMANALHEGAGQGYAFAQAAEDFPGVMSEKHHREVLRCSRALYLVHKRFRKLAAEMRDESIQQRRT